jgi:hypothetical protein
VDKDNDKQVHKRSKKYVRRYVRSKSSDTTKKGELSTSMIKGSETCGVESNKTRHNNTGERKVREEPVGETVSCNYMRSDHVQKRDDPEKNE